MIKPNVFLAVAVTYFVTGAVVPAADPGLLVVPHRPTAFKKPLAASSQHLADLGGEVESEDQEFEAHIVLWRSFDVPGAANGTQPTGINNFGEITGIYADAKNNVHGFVRKANGEIVRFDAPNAISGTFPTGVNNRGDVVGTYTDAVGVTHGFVRSARGKFKIIDDPSATSSPPATYAQAINDRGVVVGYWNDLKSNNHGYLRQIDGSFHTVDPPGDVYSQAYHINDLGEMGGDWTDAATGTSHGMILHLHGKLVTFDAPNAVTTFGGLGQALNIEGSFAGTYADPNLGTHGYVRYANGQFSEFTAPGGGTNGFNGTWSASINSLGTVVGFSYEPNGSTIDGFVRFADGTLILANAPVVGQQSTVAWAINDLNEFTGLWFDANGAEHGFVAFAVPSEE